MTVNAAIPFTVDIEVDDSGPPAGVVHRLDGAPSRILSAEEAFDDLTAAVCFALRPQGGLQVSVRRQAPMGSGLGGSSAYAVALAHAVLGIDGRTMDNHRLVPLLRDLEARIMGTPAGIQDHWAALRGGVLAVHLEPGGERIETLAVDPEWLERRMTVFFTGLNHHSGMVNWQVIRRRIEGDPTTTAALAEIAEAARACRIAVLDHDEAAVADAIRHEWDARKRLAPEVCPEPVVALERIAREAGATAVKTTGAGGGGSLLLWHPEGAHDRVADALTGAGDGGTVLASGTARTGCAVTTSNGPTRG